MKRRDPMHYLTFLEEWSVYAGEMMRRYIRIVRRTGREPKTRPTFEQWKRKP